VKCGDVWDKLGKQLDTAKRTVDKAGRRTRAVTRSLRDLETLEAAEAPALIELGAEDQDGGDEERTGRWTSSPAARSGSRSRGSPGPHPTGSAWR
jgi:DNA anti-recombination protein RmuC